MGYIALGALGLVIALQGCGSKPIQKTSGVLPPIEDRSVRPSHKNTPSTVASVAPPTVIPAPVAPPAVVSAPTPSSALPSSSVVATGSSAPYVVRKGDTLFSIALNHGQYYKDLIAWNNLENPNDIKVGQILIVMPPSDVSMSGAGGIQSNPIKLGQVEGKPISSSGSNTPVANTSKPPITKVDAKTDVKVDAKESPSPVASNEESLSWVLPAQGKIISEFQEGKNKGIDIAGKIGDPIIAAAEGKVVYVGNGLRGYGNLIIIKHAQNFISAYAHNKTMLVKEGAMVAKGQKIAEMGSSDSDKPKLHFEVRLQGKPVDPLKHIN